MTTLSSPVTDPHGTPGGNATSVQIDRAMIELPTDLDKHEDLGFVLGALRRNGDYYVFADTTNLSLLHNSNVKAKAYEFRYRLGIANAGIEPYGGPSPVRHNDEVPPLVKAEKDQTVYRQEFKLTPGL